MLLTLHSHAGASYLCPHPIKLIQRTFASDGKVTIGVFSVPQSTH